MNPQWIKINVKYKEFQLLLTVKDIFSRAVSQLC